MFPGLEKPAQIRARFLKHGFKEVVFRRLSSTIQEPGSLVALFDNKYRSKSKWISACVAVDKLLNASFAFRELLNFLREPLAKLDDWLSPPDFTSGVLVVYEKA